MNKLIATIFYVGLIPKAPGTFGSLAAIPLILLLIYFRSFAALLAVTVILYFVGVITVSKVIKETGDEDPQCAVIDEVVGMLVAFITLLGVSGAGAYLLTGVIPSEIELGQQSLGLVMLILLTLFAWFRFFDIKKPWPVSYFDQRVKNAHGVMLDDVAAGIMAGLATLMTGFVVSFVFVLTAYF